MPSEAKVALARPGAIRLEALPPLSLYVHMPWCVRKCPYCDFNSHEKKGDLPEDAYCAALVSDLEHALPWIWGRRVHSIFFGGGTPSLFSARSIDRLLSDIRSRIPVPADAEITLEANPGTFEAQKFRDFRAAGVNRLSIGIQSFNDAHLEALGRIHSADEARRAIEIAQKDFDNINLDLMYGLPEQTIAQALADVGEGIRWGTTHLSAYQLTLEPNTVFYSHPPKLPAHDLAAEMQERLEGLLAAAGFGHYETSAFAQTGRRSRHNENYWKFGDYLGLGAGAHGKISFPDRIERHARAKQPREYMAMAPEGKSITEHRVVARADLPFEFMLNALRLIEGVPVALFRERTGLEIAVIEAALAKGEALGLLERDWQAMRPTPRGQRFLNELLELFLP